MKVISGMHRSGTSLVARLFHEAGADMGDPKTFYRPDRWNPDGYFEQPDIHKINMPLVNGPWWKFSYFALPSARTIMKRAARRADQIQATAAKYQDKVVKETRFCLTLPAWLKYGGSIEKILVCLRDPIQVARSIHKRNSIPINQALKLWHIHNERLLEHAWEIPLWFVYYENMLNEKLSQTEIISAFRFFGMELTSDQLEMLHQKCVKREMNHHPVKCEAYPKNIDLLWRNLLERHLAQFH